MTHGRTDSNQSAIVSALRTVGASVESLADVGAGVPDLLVGFRGQNHLMEVKTAKGKLTGDQELWHKTWRGQKVVVRTVDEALAAIGCEPMMRRRFR